jgi:hypothetical protein
MPGERTHFYFTKNPFELPEYGNHVVAFLWGEERCKVPAYARHVRGVIRTSQLIPFLGFRAGLRLSRYEAVLVFQYARDWFTHVRSLYHLRKRAPKLSKPLYDLPRIFTIPFGYHSQEDLPQVPMRERRLDAFFAGEVHTPIPSADYRYWTSTSKAEARKQLWKVLRGLNEEGQWNIDIGNVPGGEAGPKSPEFASYSAKMMNSRICLAPRGTVAETFRFFEGLRAGCLVVCNRLPPEPYLQGVPAIQIDNWKELPALMKKYARDLDSLEQYRNASMDFWRTRLNERAIGSQVARFLQS